MKKETAMQQHINWLKGCIELLDEHAPIMEKTLMLCLKDAESRLDAEKEQMKLACIRTEYEDKAWQI